MSITRYGMMVKRAKPVQKAHSFWYWLHLHVAKFFVRLLLLLLLFAFHLTHNADSFRMSNGE